jgi:hypothetical protein
MFAYQARPRVCFRDDGRELTFPNEVHIDISFAPAAGFGGLAPPTRTGVREKNARLNYNANAGRTTVGVATPLDEITFDGVVGGIQVQLRGTHLALEFPCESRAQLEGVLNTFHHVLPLILGITFIDPPTILSTSGRVGDVPFTWQMESSMGSLDFTTNEIQQTRADEAMKRLEFIVAPDNRRLLAAISYFNRSVRLGCSGATAFEFTGEVVLNFAKCLEVLFPPHGDVQSRDAIRDGLRHLGIDPEDIETWFLPVMLLRSQVDVAHVRLTLFSHEQLRTIQAYSERAEDKFRGMIQTLITAVEDGSLSIEPYDDEGPDRAVVVTLERMKERMAAVDGEVASP